MKKLSSRRAFFIPGSEAPDRVPAAIAFISLLSAFFLAGGARDDLISLLIWRPLSAFLLAISIVLCWASAWQRGKPLVILCISVVALVAIHLVPLPPEIWVSLPGRNIVVETYQSVGMDLPWQPLSMAQARTWNALFSLAGPFAVMLAVLSLDRSRHQQLLQLLIILGMISGILGMIQAIGPANGPLYFYRITNGTASVGLFANRNHQAIFLATLYPLLAANLSLFKGRPDRLFFYRSMTIAGAALLVPLILMTGSRSGLLLAAIGMFSAWWVYRPPVAEGRVAGINSAHRTRLVGMSIAAILLMVVLVVAIRTPALQRLIDTDAASELRIQALPVIGQAISRFFPFGSGIGTFVETYQIFEPDSFVAASYFNHAHNDFAELLMTGGIAAVLLFLWAIWIGIGWFISLLRNRRIAKDEQGFGLQMLGRAGFSVLVMLALASAADYPLRTPSIMLYAMVMAAWCSSAHKFARK
ncbi:O-antigen ligase [Sphingopyxis sp.]|uniref:O-antigen ligase family protein n=1 Tax=Sphingopyxis sp. TaxID=1908224 RepID=UPI001DA9C0C3|nr:O-antigen ligase family protein [Sphingopyxis sp.]MBW8295564.1 O-antigen ligase family protein [Sphingopyxis sp.]